MKSVIGFTTSISTGRIPLYYYHSSSLFPVKPHTPLVRFNLPKKFLLLCQASDDDNNYKSNNRSWEDGKNEPLSEDGVKSNGSNGIGGENGKNGNGNGNGGGPRLNLKWVDLVLNPDPDNVVAVGLTGVLAWASVQVLWQLFVISIAILLAALKYSFIAALLIFILITLL